MFWKQETSLGISVFEWFPKSNCFKNKHFMDPVKKVLGTQCLWNRKHHLVSTFLNGFQNVLVFKNKHLLGIIQKYLKTQCLSHFWSLSWVSSNLPRTTTCEFSEKRLTQTKCILSEIRSNHLQIPNYPNSSHNITWRKPWHNYVRIRLNISYSLAA